MSMMHGRGFVLMVVWAIGCGQVSLDAHDAPFVIDGSAIDGPPDNPPAKVARGSRQRAVPAEPPAVAAVR